jgi:hypothetical protein
MNMFAEFQTSGFWNYFALFFSDTALMSVYWKEFVLSLAESLPVFQLMLTLALTLSVFVSLRFAFKDFKRFKRIGLSANPV